MKTINPATQELIKEYTAIGWNEVQHALRLSEKTWLEWRETGFPARNYLLNKMAGILRNKQQEYALLMTTEMGKVTKEALSEIEKCAWACEYYAENGEKFLSDTEVETDATSSFYSFQPMGAILAIMPWNFPFWQVLRAAIPALMAGNVMVLKHATNVTGCAIALQELFTLAGFPKGAFQTLLIPADQVARVIAHDTIAGVTLTGSVAAGKSVAAQAGKYLKKTVLELGGSDPYLILEDADIAHSAKICTASRVLNAGQTCVSAKRFIVVASVYDRFLEAFKEEMSKIKYGDPLAETTSIGPLSSTHLRDGLHQQVQASITKGAVCVLGGEIPDITGNYYPATILTHVTPGMPAYDEELFGPVASVIKAKDEADAVRIANDSEFGLGAAVFTKDIKRGERIAKNEIQAGLCFVNGMVRSDPRLPFGGVKHSGYGRELSLFGIREFTNIKTVVIA
jgi:succinate-semialdehyde dehydrogenase/glutarate-semialdehyde dehydrogenase